MNRLEMAFTHAAVNNVVQKSVVVGIARQFDTQEEESMLLLKSCLSWVGMDLGERINAHLASLQGKKFNVTEYLYEKPVGEQ